MNDIADRAMTVVVERDIAHAPEKVWRALTEPHLIAEWLMKNDFRAAVDARFTMSGDWGAVDCRVLELREHRLLSYTWEAFGLESTVIWTLTPSEIGTHLRMEQAGFKPDQVQFYGGAKASWPQFVDALEALLARLE